MLARLALSRGIEVALSLLIVVLAAVLVFSLLAGSGSSMNSLSRSDGSGASPTTAGSAGDGGIITAPGEAAAETLRQRSLR